MYVTISNLLIPNMVTLDIYSFLSDIYLNAIIQRIIIIIGENKIRIIGDMCCDVLHHNIKMSTKSE